MPLLTRRHPMLTLCGFAASNYYNKVKLALLEKGVPFDRRTGLGRPDRPGRQPAGQGALPEDTTKGAISESTVLLEYIEAEIPPPTRCCRPTRLPPPRCASCSRYTELHLELVARNLYPEAFFGGKVSDAAKEKTGAAAGEEHRRVRASSRSSRPTWPATPSPWPTAAAHRAPATGQPAPPRSSTAATTWPTCRYATTSNAWASGRRCRRSTPTAR
jgi:hypothetical protein